MEFILVCFNRFQSKEQKTSELKMLHYIFIHSYLMFVKLVDVLFSHANSGKQTLFVAILFK